MKYEASVRYLLSLGRELAAPTQAAAAKFDLQNITVLAERLGRPERTYPSAHIAGTNGKGSTAAFLESILRHAGFRTGLNTSPHLEKINERIRINGEEIDRKSTRLNSSHGYISYAVFCLKKKNTSNRVRALASARAQLSAHAASATASASYPSCASFSCVLPRVDPVTTLLASVSSDHR